MPPPCRAGATASTMASPDMCRPGHAEAIARPHPHGNAPFLYEPSMTAYIAGPDSAVTMGTFLKKLLGILRAHPLLLVIAVLGGSTAYVALACEFAWETGMSPRQPMIPVRVYPGAERIDLSFIDGQARIKFRLAASFATARTWAVEDKLPEDPAKLIECDGMKELVPAGVIGWTVKCEADIPARKLKLSVSGAAQPAEPKTVFLIPYVEEPVVSNAAGLRRWLPWLRWTSIFLKQTSETVSAKDCVLDQDARLCALASDILGHPHVLLSRDPHDVLGRAAAFTMAHIAPATLFAMMVVDAILFFFLILLLVVWGTRGQLAPEAESSKSQPAPGVPWFRNIDSVYLGFRRTLEWLEVTGPAMAFVMTAGSLLVAFEANVLVVGDVGRFSHAVGVAMAATFAGLLMRVLAFSVERLLDYLLRASSDVSPMGLFSPPQVSSGPPNPPATPSTSPS